MNIDPISVTVAVLFATNGTGMMLKLNTGPVRMRIGVSVYAFNFCTTKTCFTRTMEALQ